ncbi:outer membrane protein assembly factor BamB family protein [Dactylosporangium darangshiense]|uniref:Pyrrolo-quinoline quinone repeat domain-containing protein n=1 Tax=Dactylosporangium darangshiense TaxID=579108 RepID=A0ABP8DWG5_9ACTN
MSTELDAFFAALRRDADEVPAAPPDAARRLGRRRRRQAAVVAVVAVFAVVGTIVVAIGAGLPRGQQPPAGPSPVTPTAAQKPTTFQRLAPVGAGIGLGQLQPPRLATVVTMGDRAFVCLQSESGQTSVVAVDLATGRAAWGPVHLADFSDTAAVYWHPRYVLIMGRHDNGSRPDGTIFALDPATGTMLMHLDVDNFEADDVVLGESTLVTGARRDGKTRGYDMATGRVQWTVPDPASRIVDSLVMQSAAGSPLESQRGGFGGPPVATSQFVQLTADGTAIVRDLATGAESVRRAGAVSAATGDSRDQVLAVDGILYVIDRDKHGTIRAADISGPAAATDVYTATNGVQIGQPVWCGPNRICFEELGKPGDEHVTALDTAAQKVRWRQDGSIFRLQVVNGQVLLNLMTQSGDLRNAVVDASGRQILSEQAQTGTAGWIDGNALLVIGPGDRDSPTSVSGVSPLTGGPVQLGVVDDNRGCGWSRTHLVCATITGIKVWRFAA